MSTAPNTPPTVNGGGTGNTANGDQTQRASKGKGGKGSSNRPSPEEIEAKRAARALKKHTEALEKAAKQEALRRSLLDSGDADGRVVGGHLDADGNVLYIPRSWGVVSPTPSPSTAADAERGTGRKVKFLSWNILAQGLVRRKLFLGSDCLKFKDREAGLTAELSSRTGHGWDVGCFQEVDRMEVHGETLQRDGFAYVYEKGYKKKQHGLLIAWREVIFGESEHRRIIVDLDEEEVREPATAAASQGVERRTGCSRVTRNVGLFVSLRFSHSPSAEQGTSSTASAPGIIVATTHLFWHPMHAYERARQSGILVRRLDDFRKSLGSEWRNATVVLAGDFNDQPHSATYHLLTGMELTEHCRQEIRESTVVHKSMDEKRERMQSVAPSVAAAEAGNVDGAGASGDAAKANGDDEGEVEEVEGEEEEEEGGADDQMLKNCRAATEADGLLSIDELLQLHDLSRPLIGAAPSKEGSDKATSLPRLGLMSSYGSHYGKLAGPEEKDNFFGTKARGRERHDDESWKDGQDNMHTGDSKEPMWTIFSSLFSLTLDYIFVLPTNTTPSVVDEGAGSEGRMEKAGFPKVTRLLRTHRTETLAPGVPRKGVCASDHVAVGAEVVCCAAAPTTGEKEV